MKQLFIFFIATFIIAYTAKAQAEFGITGGANFSNIAMDINDEPEKRLRIGGNLGVYGNFIIADKISIEPHLLYTMMGTIIEDYEDGVDVTYALDYLAIPLAVNYEASEGVGIYLAPQVGFTVRREMFAEISGEKVTASLKDTFKEIDFGLRTGVNYTSPTGIGGGVGYYLGLIDIIENESDSSIKNVGFNVNLRYHFY